MKGQLRIDQMWAFITKDSDGTEGVVGWLGPLGNMPMVGADTTRIAQLRPIAQQIAKGSGRVIKLVKFTVREEIEEITP